MNDGDVVIDVELNTDGVEKGVKRAERSIRGISDDVVRFAGKTATAMGAVGLAVSAFSFKAAGDMQALNAQFDEVFAGVSRSAKKNLNSIAKETNMLPNRLKGPFVQMAAFAKTAGMSTADALDLTSRATTAAADITAMFNGNIETVTESLQSYLKGNYENDSALGISSTETTRNAAANKLYSQSFNDLSESQKQLTLLQMVEDGNKLTGALGQAAREAGGMETILGNLRQSVIDLAAAFGTPMLEPFLSTISVFTNAMSGLAAAFVKDPALVYAVVGAFTTLALAFTSVWVKAVGISKAMEFATTVFGTMTNPIFLIVAAIGALITAFVYFYNSSKLFKKAVDGSIKFAFNVITGTVKGIINLFKKIVSVMNSTIKSVKDFVGKFIKEFFTLKKLNEIIHDIFPQLVIDAAVTSFKTLSKIVGKLTKGFEAFKLVSKGSLSNLGDLQNYLRDTFSMDTIQKIWNVGTQVKNIGLAFKAVKDVVKNFMTDFKKLGELNGVLRKVLPDKVADAISNSLIKILTPIKQVETGIKALAKIATGSISNFKELDTFLGDVFGSEAKAGFQRILDTVNQTKQSVKEFTDSVKKNVTDAFNSVANPVKAFGVEMLTALADGNYKLIADRFKGIANSISDFAETAKGYIAVTGIYAAFMVSNFLSSSKVFEIISDRAADFGINLQAVFDFVIEYVQNFVKKLTDFKDSIFEIFKTGNFQPFIDSFVKLLPTIIGILLGGIPGLIFAGARIILGIADGMNKSVPELLEQAVEFVAKFISNIVKELPKFFKVGADAIKKIGEGFKGSSSSVMNILGDFVTKIGELFGEIPALISSALGFLSNMFSDLGTGIKNGSSKAISKSKSSISELISNIVNGLAKAIPEMFKLGAKLFVEFAKGIISVISVVVKYVADIIIAIVDAITSKMPELTESGINLLVALIDGIVKGLPRLVDSAFDLIEAWSNAVIEKLPELVKIGNKMLRAVVKGIISVGNELVKLALELLNAFIDSFFNLSSGLIDLGAKIVKNIIKGIKQYLSNLVDIGSEIVDALLGGISSVDTSNATSFLSRFSTAFSDFADDVAKNAPGIGKSFGKMMKGIYTGVFNAIPDIMSGMSEVIKAVLGSLKEALPSIIIAAGQLVVAIANGLRQSVPQMILAIGELVVEILVALGAAAGDIAFAGMQMLLSLIAGIMKGLPDLVDAVANLVITFLLALGENIDKIVDAGATLLINFLQGIKNNLSRVVDMVGNVIIAFTEEVIKKLPELIASGADLLVAWLKGIADNLGKIIDATFDIISAFLQGIANNLPRIITDAVKVIAAFVKGIGDNIQPIIDSGMYLLDKLIKGFLDFQDKLSKAAIKLINGMAENIRENREELKAAGKNLLDAILEGLPGSGLFQRGKDMAQSFLDGLGDLGKAVGGVVNKINPFKSFSVQLSDQETAGAFSSPMSRSAFAMPMTADSQAFAMPQISAEKIIGSSRFSNIPKNNFSQNYGRGKKAANRTESETNVTIEVPVILEGKEISRVTAPYMESDLAKRQRRAARNRGDK